MHILLIEDDQKAARLLARGLQEEGFEVAVAHSAEEADASLLVACQLIIQIGRASYRERVFTGV